MNSSLQRNAELDAYYARLHGLTRDQLRYTLRVDPKEPRRGYPWQFAPVSDKLTWDII